MKKILYLIPVILLTAACAEEDFLDKKPLDKLSEEAVFNSASLAEAYVNAAYTVLPDPFTEGNISCITDEGYFRYGGTSTRYIASGTMTPSNVMYIDEGGQAHNTRTTQLNIWNRAYERIYNLNYFIDYVNEKGTQMTKEDTDRLMGESYYLRAWAYYNLIQRYAGVPVIKTPNNLDDDFGVERSTFDECVDFILEDLELAEALVPVKAEAAQGRINKDIVLALRARVTLLAASKLFNDPDSPEGTIFKGKYDYEGKWQRAYDACKAVVDRADVEGAYTLDQSYTGYWMNPNSPEVIWAKYFTNLGRKAQLYYGMSYYSGWSSMEPTQAMVIDYEMTNGKKFFEEGSGYDPANPFANRDPRFYMTCAAPGDTWDYTDNEGYHEEVLDLYHLYENRTRQDFIDGVEDKNGNIVLPEPDKTSKDLVSDQRTQTTGIMLKKWFIPTVQTNEDECGSIMYPWFRLAEFYLNFAECAYMLGKEDECRMYINKVRSRADVMMPHVTESGASLWDRLVNERRIEMAFEFMRYFDLRRWMVADFYENVPVAGMRTCRLENNGQVDVIYRMARLYDAGHEHNQMLFYWDHPKNAERPNYTHPGGELESVFTYSWLGKEYKIDYGDCALTITPLQKYFPEDGRNYLMPIPQEEITKSQGSIVQNPGY